MAELVCWSCGASLEDVPRPISRHSNCPKCFQQLRCCRMCRSYDERYNSKCGDERTDPPVEKETANFCDFFRPLGGAFSAEEAEGASGAKEKLDALFGGGDTRGVDSESGKDESAGSLAEETKDDEVRAELDKLFSTKKDDET